MALHFFLISRDESETSFQCFFIRTYSLIYKITMACSARPINSIWRASGNYEVWRLLVRSLGFAKYLDPKPLIWSNRVLNKNLSLTADSEIMWDLKSVIGSYLLAIQESRFGWPEPSGWRWKFGIKLQNKKPRPITRWEWKKVQVYIGKETLRLVSLSVSIHFK